ncbi:TPA: isoprenylcysteine carboxylmethyltransferase family protein [Candidatus Bathyarchaeota archaeon]|nr:isoprenylcysteine carboxylmethyltransferase family protein [Candidatus Bathyarchaeota archaeon]
MDLLAPTTIIGAALILLGIYYIVFWWSYWKTNYRGKLLTGGPYAIVRHPYYFGFLILTTGLVVIIPQVETIGLALLSWMVIISQIKTEEEALIKQYGNKYREYQDMVRYRLIPGVY